MSVQVAENMEITLEELQTLGRTGGHKNVRILETHMPSHNHSIHNKDIGNHSHTANTSYAGNHYHEQGHPHKYKKSLCMVWGW